MGAIGASTAAAKLARILAFERYRLGLHGGARLAKPENGTSRYEYRLAIGLLQFHELGRKCKAPSARQQAGCSFEKSLPIDHDFPRWFDTIDIISLARVDLGFRFGWFWWWTLRRLNVHRCTGMSSCA